MDDSILDSVKSEAGVIADDGAFDDELILYINTAFMTLRQVGVGPENPFIISDNSAVWSDFTDDMAILPMVKAYVGLKVRLLFDPPTSSSLATAIQNSVAEYEWRLNLEADKYNVEEDEKYANRRNSF